MHKKPYYLLSVVRGLLLLLQNTLKWQLLSKEFLM